MWIDEAYKVILSIKSLSEDAEDSYLDAEYTDDEEESEGHLNRFKKDCETIITLSQKLGKEVKLDN